MRGLRWLLWLLVPVVGLIELGAHVYFSRRAPRIGEYEALVPVITRLRKQDELVVVAPYWAEPNVRRVLGDTFMPLEDVARPDESAHRRAIEVSILGASAPELEEFRVVEEVRHGPFQVRVLQNEHAADVRYDFLDHVKTAVVRNGHSPCPWNEHARRSAGGLPGHPAFRERRHECDGDSHFVGITVIEDETWRPRRCLWAKPTRQPLSIEFRDVPLNRVIRGYGGAPWLHERERRGGVITLTVKLDGEPLGRYVHRDGDGWTKFEFSTKGKQSGNVEFVVEARGGGERQFCFQADAR